jgi:hypothetical protein
MDGAPCFFSGSLTPGGCGLPSTGRLADCFVVGNGKIQEGSKVAGDQPHKVVADPKLSPGKKEKILDNMEQDARQFDTATAEGMTGGEPSNLHQVLDAKEKLEGDPAKTLPTDTDAKIPRKSNRRTT